MAAGDRVVRVLGGLTVAQAPNIVFILADDLGWADLGVYGATDFATPHLDRLAGQGVRFTQAYANSAVCSATRIALITGRYQYRLRAGLEEPIALRDTGLGLPPEHPTLPSLLKAAGYDTALIGKWHLGLPPQYGPLQSGYDRFFGNLHGAIDYFTHKPGVGDDVARDLWENEVPVERAGYYTQVLADEATAYINARAGQGADERKPFFLSLHFTAPHWPWEGPGDEAVAHQIKSLFHYDGGSLRKYGEIVEALDAAVGQVLAALHDVGEADSTIVVFTSDNGGERFSKTWPFTGQKTELLEGGLRVPTLLRWSARIAPQVQHQVTASMDWLPTLLAAAGLSPHADYPSDGENILPVLQGAAPVHSRTLYWRYKAQAQRAVRDGDWKYLKVNDNEFLFDVAEDERERANLRDLEPAVFARLKTQWAAWDAQFLPITDDVYTHGVTPDIQADRYVPHRLTRG
ncbi:twin-arginine translocation pathway signal protein [Acidovorax sp. Leaf76]|uniref:sulfatase family protein n=1 Tax=unclassified Acidovorax TaxID=2684926 RepID=UPI0006F70589|nr:MULTISPECIES: sulfatase-like hydrolase/transferase [unclassified Acidovorax]KQO12681.1 twin-arginine translocation pathway signal protein [Acidovorax sp. Leaf76]KQO30417.1 twin-arginine translocation pathway signal protein [Acidovorax sp. Leaf84]KQS28695.1 twin-arginine translocation pathway signal protein [Acidovorax sp. Leaf191]